MGIPMGKRHKSQISMAMCVRCTFGTVHIQLQINLQKRESENLSFQEFPGRIGKIQPTLLRMYVLIYVRIMKHRKK